MKRERTWHFFFRIVIMLIMLKLTLSSFVHETEVGDSNGSSFWLFGYYFIDYLLLITAIVFTWKMFSFKKKMPSINLDFYRIGLLMIGLCIFTSQVNNKEIIVSISSLSRFIIPVFLFTAIILYTPRKIYYREVSKIPIVVVILSCFAFLFFEKSKNRDEFFWPVYFSGLHTQAYVVLTVFFLLCFRYWDRKRKTIIIILIICAIVSLGFGYNVRTSLTSLIAFFLYYLAKKLYLNNLTRHLLVVVFIVIIFFSYVFFENYFSIKKYDFESSGRLSVYLERFNFISSRGFFENLFGTGAGSDLMLSDTWWWEEKGSHNDYLTIIIEQGFLFLLLFVLLFYKMFIFFKDHSFIQAMLFSYLVSSVLSNGFTFRPLPSYLFFVVVAYVYLVENHKYGVNIE